MLKFLGKRNRSRNALLILFIVVLAVGLIIAFVPAFTGVIGTPGNDDTIAAVDGYEVTVKELLDGLNARSQQQMQGGMPSRFDDSSSLYDRFGPEVIEDLIRQKLIQQQAEELNLFATDPEVQERIKAMFNPWPGPEQYRSRIQRSGYTVERFENELRASISEEKLRTFVSAAAQVTPQEVEEDYRRNKTNYNVRIVEVDPSKLLDKVQVSDSALRAYYDANQQQYYVGTEQRRSRYIFVDMNKAGETIHPAEEELRKDFDPERGVQQVRVSQIVLNIPKQAANSNSSNTTAASQNKSNSNASVSNKNAAAAKKPLTEDDVRKKADEIVARLRGQQGKPPEDFGKLARELSQDARTAAAQGDIGWVNKKDNRTADDPLNRVFTMKKDEIAPPVKKDDKFYIFKVTDRKIPTFEESREQLIKEARATRSYSKAVEISTEAVELFKQNHDAEATSAEINKKYGTELISVRESELFSQGESPKTLSLDFTSAVFELANIGDIADRQNVSNGFAIPQFTEKKDPHQPPFEEVRTKVEEQYRKLKADEMASARARQLAGTGSPNGLKTLAESFGLKVDERTGLTGSDAIGPLTSEYDRAQVHKLNPGQVTAQPIKPYGAESYAVVGLTNRKDPDMAEFQKERKAIEERLIQEKRNILFSTFLATTEKRLKEQGKIKIYQDVIDKVVRSNEDDATKRPLRRGPAGQ